MTIPFTPLRVAVVTGLVVAASIGAPQLAFVRNQVKGDIVNTLDRYDGPPDSAESETAPVFRYKDKKGRTHYVTSLEKVPAEYQSKVEKDVKLPKVTYSDYPLATTTARTTDDTRSPLGLPVLAPARHGGGGGNGDVGLLGGGSEEGAGNHRGGGQDHDSEPDQKPLLGFITKWLYFARDTFNQMSSFMSGR